MTGQANIYDISGAAAAVQAGLTPGGPDFLTFNNLVAASADPAVSSSSLTLANAALYTKLVVARGVSTTKLFFRVLTAGNKGSTGAGGAAIYLWNSAGTIQASLTSSAIDTALTTLAIASPSWASGPIPLTVGAIYIVGLWLPTNWQGGSGAIAPITSVEPAGAVAININTVSPLLRTGATSGGAVSSTLPGTISSGLAPWFGLA